MSERLWLDCKLLRKLLSSYFRNTGEITWIVKCVVILFSNQTMSKGISYSSCNKCHGASHFADDLKHVGGGSMQLEFYMGGSDDTTMTNKGVTGIDSASNKIFGLVVNQSEKVPALP